MNKQEFEIAFNEINRLSQDCVNANMARGSHEPLKDLFSKFYPDEVHIIYELLQNAEDAKASEVTFKLTEDGFEFIHNGKKGFDINDIDSITNIAKSTKTDEFNQIGKFGIGFKSVYAYTNSPYIKSGKFEFEIIDWLVPVLRKYDETSNNVITSFLLPFNHLKKTNVQAFKDIGGGLDALNTSSVLFLNNIITVSIYVNGKISRVINKKKSNKYTEITINNEKEYWIVFNKDFLFEDLKKSFQVSIAYSFDIQKNKIIPIDKADVFVYFPCKKEISNLKFHINAPFESEPSRASINYGETNQKLIEAIADLAAESLLIIKEKKLLTTDFLGVLPNSDDELDEFYSIVQNKILNKFHSENLLPMKNGEHGPTSGVFLPDNIIDSLLSEEDLVSLFNMYIKGNVSKSPIWVNNIHSSRVTTFYKNLNIKFFRFREFIEFIHLHKCIDFFNSKDTNWHRKFYALLNENDKGVEIAEGFFRTKPQYLAETHPIILLQNGNYEKSNNCYFTSDDVKEDIDFNFIDKNVYSYPANNEIEQKEAQAAYNYLDKVNVKKIDEEVLIKYILDKKYQKDNFKPDINDITRFINFAEKNKDKYNYEIFFKDYFIIKLADGKWVRPIDAYLDVPFIKTNLSLYYNYLSVNIRKYNVNEEYLKIISKEKLIKFLKLFGVVNELIIQKIPCHNNMRFGYPSGYEIDENYTIEGLSFILANEKIVNLSVLIWNKMNELDNKFLNSYYCPNKSKSTETKYSDSTLVEILKKQEWIPINENNNIKFVTPRKATKSTLVNSLVYDARKEWLQRIEFGFDEKEYQDKQNIEKQNNEITKAQKEVIIKSIGFKNETEFNEAIDLGKKLKSSGKTQKELDEFLKPKPSKPLFPQNDSKDPTYREKQKEKELLNSTKIMFKPKIISRRDSNNTIDKKSYLKRLYTNTHDIMVCQLCQNEMPFKTIDKEYYFEAVQIIKSTLLKNEDESQYIALCPVCSARYNNYILNNDKKMAEIKQNILKENIREITLKLDIEFNLKFVGKHWIDLKTALKYSDNNDVKKQNKQ